MQELHSRNGNTTTSTGAAVPVIYTWTMDPIERNKD